jgi:hypothetical protein
MCKVTIKKVEKIHKAATGATEGRSWTLHIMDCLISVDGSEKEAVRVVKTFEADIAQKINTLPEGQTLEFEAEKKPDGSVYEYMIKKQGGGFRNRGGRNGSEPFGPTNRQQALKVAVELERAQSAISGEVPTALKILETAEVLLNWLNASI